MPAGFFDPEEIVEETGLSRGSVYRNLEPYGPIPCIRIGRRCLVPKTRWEKFKEEGGRIPDKTGVTEGPKVA